MVKKALVTQTASATWAADTTIATDIERVGLLTRLDLTVEVTPSATLTAANQPDGAWRVVRNLVIRGGSQTYITLPNDDGAHGGTILHYRSMVDGFGAGHRDGAIAAPQSVYTAVNFPVHMGVRPKHPDLGYYNPFDLSAYIPAGVESQLVAEWSTSGNDVMDDSVTISSAVGRYTLWRVTGSEGEMMAEMNRQGVPGRGMVPQWSAQVFAPSGTSTDFNSQRVDVVVGAYLARVFVLAQDATATRPVRSTDELVEVAFQAPEDNQDLIRVRAEHMYSHLPYGSWLTANSGASESAGTEKFGADFNNHAPGGILMLDLRPHAVSPLGRMYGLNLTQSASGAYKLGFIVRTNAAGDDGLILWERYAPYFGNLVTRP